MRWMWLMIAVLATVLAGCTPEVAEEAALIAFEWTTPLEAELVGVALDVEIEGASLQEIVSGQIEARGEGRTCSACHFEGSVVQSYSPGVAQYSTQPVGAYDLVHGRTWAGNDGWAARFATLDANANVEKPRDLRLAMERFLEAEANRVEPLSWDATITVGNLGVTPNPVLAGDSIGRIVNSVAAGREDGLKCSTCHYTNGPYAYRPQVAANGTTSFGPDDVVDGRSWSGPEGWAARFASIEQMDEKPPYLQALFFKWNDDGGM